jgi:hypothetical protein
MTKILAFDSMYIVNPVRKVYTGLVSQILNGKNPINNRLVLYRLDQDNVLINDKRNLTGMAIGAHKDHIEALSIEFYRYLEKSGSCNELVMKNQQLYQLYTRQVKLKLAGVLKCAFRIRSLSIDSGENLEIITDRQTVSIVKEVFLFLNYEPTNITWRVNGLLTSCISINSLIMRFSALVKMFISPSDLPKNYFYKYVDSAAPTILITMPKRRPDDFFSTYVEKLGGEFNIVLYSMGLLQTTPDNYKRIDIKRTTGVLRGIFNIKNICWSADSYIADILLIYRKHANLSASIDVTASIFSNKIDAHISRLQTSIVDNLLAIEARRRGVFILGDVFEEVYYCDSAVCASKSENTDSLKLALASSGKVTYKGSNSLINYRLKNFSDKKVNYLHELLKVDTQKKIIFYASDPSKEESQRYLTERFLIDSFSRLKDFIFVIKTHPQDNGKVTHYAYLDSGKPFNVILIGDITQGSNIISKQFILFDNFDFNVAISSSDGFLTFSSSSILQALTLGVKTGIVDKFGNGFYDYLINHKATMLINSEESLKFFLDNQKLDVSDDILSYCGLKNDNEEFDVGRHLLKCLGKFDKNNENKQPTGI